MRTSSLLFAVASTATLAAAQSYDYGPIQRNPLTAQAPSCATACFAIKVQQGDALVGSQTNVADKSFLRFHEQNPVAYAAFRLTSRYCMSQTWAQAYSNCCYDNCAASDIPVAILVLQTLCADLGVAVPISAVTGPATTVSLPPVTLNTGATTAASGSATAITSGSMSESTGLVTSTDSTGGVVVGPGGGIRTSINLDSASTLPIGASSTVSGALGSASSGISGAAGTASSALSGAASSATGAVGGAASSVVNGASSVVSAASGGLQSAMPSNPVSAAGSVAAPVAFTMAGLLLTIFA